MASVFRTTDRCAFVLAESARLRLKGANAAIVLGTTNPVTIQRSGTSLSTTNLVASGLTATSLTVQTEDILALISDLEARIAALEAQ
jgi:hypothetical protein